MELPPSFKDYEGQPWDDIVTDVAPWPQPVNGVILLDEVEATIRRYLVCGPSSHETIALWVAATWFVDIFHVAPILNLVSPAPRCGKTTCSDIILRLVRRSLPTCNLKPAALFRTIDECQPTLVIDEADTFFSKNPDLLGLINSGHTRQTAFVIRMVRIEKKLRPKKFSTFAFKSISGIGKRAPTIEDRSIHVSLKRKLSTEKTEKIRYAPADLFKTLERKLARWALDNADKVGRMRPLIPETLNDRQGDNWEPLLAIAEVAGGPWPEKARRASVNEMVAEESDQANLFLAIKEIFEEKGCHEIFSETLVMALLAVPDHPWGETKSLTQLKLARILNPYGITTKTMRIGNGRAKGYVVKDFLDAFNRYIPTVTVTPVTTNKIKDLDEKIAVTKPKAVTAIQSRNPLKSFIVTDVTNKKHPILKDSIRLQYSKKVRFRKDKFKSIPHTINKLKRR